MKITRLLAVLVVLASAAPPLSGQTPHWPMFRGPNATGLGEGPPPLRWSVPDARAIRWMTPVPGSGHSSPIVWGDRVFVTTAVSAVPRDTPSSTSGMATVKDDGVQSWRVLCLDRSTGRILWDRAAHTGEPRIGRHPKASHANSTPVTDGQHVVAYFGSEGLYAYDMDGTLLWSKDLGVIDVGYVGRAEYQWSTASSPVIHDGRVIIQADSHERSFIAAFDVATGRELWRQTRDELPSWTTPVIAPGPGGPVLVTNAPKFIRGLDPSTGRELWRVADEAVVKVPTPVVGGGLVVASGGNPSGRPFHAIRPGIGVPAADRVAWTAPKGGPYTPTPIIVGSLLYVLADNGVFSCYDLATGALRYQSRVSTEAGTYSASPIAVGDRIFLSTEDGTIHVVKAGPTFELLASNPMGEGLMATPAVAGDLLVVRGVRHVFGIGH
jgi:outer membrane protein assembly factor BamB